MTIWLPILTSFLGMAFCGWQLKTREKYRKIREERNGKEDEKSHRMIYYYPPLVIGLICATSLIAMLTKVVLLLLTHQGDALFG